MLIPEDKAEIFSFTNYILLHPEILSFEAEFILKSEPPSTVYSI